MPEIRDISHFFAANGVRSLKLSGGEPTVRNDLPDIIDAISAVSLKPVVITNGFAVSAAAMEACARAQGEFKFSIHRPSARNDEILGRISFGEIVGNMTEVVSREIRLSINTVVTPASRKIMGEMVDFACAVGAGKVSFIPVVARGRAKRRSDYSFLPDELDEISRSVEELARSHEGQIAVRCIDIRHHDYWVVENDGSLWIERATEEADVKLREKEHLKIAQ